MYVHLQLNSLCFTAETNTTLQINSTPNLKKEKKNGISKWKKVNNTICVVKAGKVCDPYGSQPR